MAKTKSPFFSMEAHGSLGGSVTAQKLHTKTILRSKPLPSDPYSLPQAYQRWLYEDYAYLWTQQTEVTKRQYSALGSRFHLTGLQYWMKVMLSTMPDIAGWWHLDEKAGSIARDSSKNANHGTIFGATPDTGVIDGCYSLDGINDRVAIPTSPSLDLKGTFSAYCYIKRADTNRLETPMGKGVSASRSWWVEIHANAQNNIIGFIHYASSGPSQDFYTTLAISDLNWHRLGVIFIASSSLIVSLDGVRQSVATAHADTRSSTGALYLGSLWATTQWWKGTIDEAILYNRAVSAGQEKSRRYP